MFTILSTITRMLLPFCVVALLLASTLASGASNREPLQQPIIAPLPLDVSAAQKDMGGRFPLDLSPDGQWVGYTYFAEESLPGEIFSNTGVPDFDGSRRLVAGLTNIHSGETVILGSPRGSAWSPIWSPDGARVAFYSDEGGQAELWIWETENRQAHRFAGVAVRPYWGTETVRWMSDSRHLVCKILPKGVSVAQANSTIPDPKQADRMTFPPHAPDAPSILVYRSPQPKGESNAVAPEGRRAMSTFASDLAILDVQTNSVERIAQNVTTRWFVFSPDSRYLAYNVLPEKDNPTYVYDLLLYNLKSRQTRTLAHGLDFHAGNEIAWSPTSRQLAYHTNIGWDDDRVPFGGPGKIFVIDIDGQTREFKSPDGPSFTRETYRGPLWDEQGDAFFDLSAGKLWRFDVQTGKATIAVDITGSNIVSVVSRRDRATVWSAKGDESVWLLARSVTDKKYRIYRADPASGSTQINLETDQAIHRLFDSLGSDAGGQVVFMANDQQHLDDVWTLDISSGRSRQVTHVNPEIERYKLGAAKVIHWYGLEGQRLSGALLLPSTYQPWQRVPLVVWVYGGSYGSNSVNTFGFWDDPQFDMQVLATRGYAVFYPDAPLRAGLEVTDLASTVLTGVNAAIEQGFVDPEKIGVMGQSYGSYCVLSLITQSNRFKAAVITGAVLHPDLVADYLSQLRYSPNSNSYYEAEGQNSMGGTPWQYPSRYIANSPIYLFDKIETPLLIGQGELDTPLNASQAIFYGLSRLGKKVEYRVYENEGHDFDHKADVIDFWRRRVEFLDEHLNIKRDATGTIIQHGDPAR